MQGTILTFQNETNTGLISGHDGNRYTFTRSDWAQAKGNPREGQTVDFETEEKKAIQIIPLKNLSAGGKSKTSAILLCFFLGGFGAHKFYLGKTGQGIIYLLFFWTFIPALIAFIEFFILILMKDEEFNQRYNY